MNSLIQSTKNLSNLIDGFWRLQNFQKDEHVHRNRKLSYIQFRPYRVSFNLYLYLFCSRIKTELFDLFIRLTLLLLVSLRSLANIFTVTKTSKGKVIFNFGIWLGHMKTKNIKLSYGIPYYFKHKIRKDCRTDRKIIKLKSKVFQITRCHQLSSWIWWGN